MKLLSRSSLLLLGSLCGLVVIVLAIRFVWTAPFPLPAPLENVTLGTVIGERSALIWVAENRGLLRDCGVDLTIKAYESGLAASKDVSAGNLDLATAAEIVVVHENMRLGNPHLKTIALISRVNDIRIVARKDCGIACPADLKGKRIGVLPWTDADFFLSQFCVLDRIPRSSISEINLNPGEQVEALEKGMVDAVIVWEPFASLAERELGTNAIAWSSQNQVPSTWVIVGTDESIARRATAITRLLKALLAAEVFASEHRKQAADIIQQRIQKTLPANWWDNTVTRVTLDRQLVLGMEDRARWIQAKSPATYPRIPNVLNFIALDTLEAISPDRVTIIH